MNSTKTKIAALIALSLTSGSAFALSGNSTPVEWNTHDNIVGFDGDWSKFNCTGTVIGANKVLTAQHCSYAGTGGQRPVHTQKDGQIETARIDAMGTHDLAIWTLEQNAKTTHFYPVSPEKVEMGQEVKVVGFGSTGKELHTGVMNVNWIDQVNTVNPEIFDILDNGNGNIIEGDSGSPAVIDGKIYGIANSRGHVDGVMDATYQATSGIATQQFILNTVDGWHFPTYFNIDDLTEQTIQFQSLHTYDVGDIANQLNATGGISYNLDEIKCEDSKGVAVPSNDVKPFDVCTVKVSITDNGTLNLGDDVITFEKTPVDPDSGNGDNGNDNGNSGDNNNGNGGSDSSGGSVGFFGLIAMLGMAVRRRFA